MKQQFHFDIKNTRAKQIRLLGNLILFLNALVIIYFSRNTRGQIVLGVLVVIMIVADIFYKKKKGVLGFLHNSMVVPLFLGWKHIGYWWIAIIMWLLSLFAQIAALDKKIIFNLKGIKLTSSFGKTFNWADLQNVILKDGLLTLDFKNNKLLQTPILNELDEVETKQFNDFCNQQLATSN